MTKNYSVRNIFLLFLFLSKIIDKYHGIEGKMQKYLYFKHHFLCFVLAYLYLCKVLCKKSRMKQTFIAGPCVIESAELLDTLILSSKPHLTRLTVPHYVLSVALALTMVCSC